LSIVKYLAEESSVTSGTAEVPASIGDVTPQWLTEVLGTDVTDIHAEQIAQDSGFSSLLYRLHITGSAGVPSTVIVKLPAQSEARGAMEMLGGYRRELSYYRDIAGRAPMDTPHVYAALMAQNSVDFVLVLEDLRNWENADHLAGLSMDRARLVIAQLAGLHAWSVDPANAAAVQAFPSLDTAINRDILHPAFGPGWQIYCEKSDAPVPPAVARFAERFAEQAPTEREMLLHGDIRADNMFFDGDRLKVVDFQFTARGCGAADVAYLVSQGLPTQARRGHDEALVREYLACLAARGVDDYSFEDAWRHYRFGVAYLMVLPVITLLGWDAMPERSRQLCVTLTERAVAAIDDIGALEVFG
jgi:hypothetical protein